MKIYSEKDIEKTLATHIRARKGMCIKLFSYLIRGLPDRLCLLPGARIFFVEVKSPGKKPSKFQSLIHRQLRDMGFDVFVIDNMSDLKSLLREL